MSLARSAFTGLAAGSVAMAAAGPFLLFPTFDEAGSQTGRTLFFNLMPFWLVGAVIGVFVLTPYLLLRDRLKSGFATDLIACLSVPGLFVLVSGISNGRARVLAPALSVGTLLVLVTGAALAALLVNRLPRSQTSNHLD